MRERRRGERTRANRIFLAMTSSSISFHLWKYTKQWNILADRSYKISLRTPVHVHTHTIYLLPFLLLSHLLDIDTVLSAWITIVSSTPRWHKSRPQALVCWLLVANYWLNIDLLFARYRLERYSLFNRTKKCKKCVHTLTIHRQNSQAHDASLVCECICMCMCVCMRVCERESERECMWVSARVCVCVCVCVCVFVCVRESVFNT